MINIKSITKKRILTGMIFLGMVISQTVMAETLADPSTSKIDGSSKVVKKIKMIVTAYSSTPEQTDNTPFITASGKSVIDGIVANNMLPFGARIRIPELYGDKIFVVEDRMHQRKGKYHLDVWLSEYLQARNFGAKITYIEVLES